MGVPILTAEYHTQYIWLILLTKIYECSLFRHVTAPCAVDTVVCYLRSSSRPMAKPHPKPMSMTRITCSLAQFISMLSRPDLDAELF